MASSVFYKFASRRDESRVTFDGTGISVFDLKREIILANNLGKANDFDLHIYDPTSKQEYKDDTHVIPRSSSVIVKRLPAGRPGRGRASLYVNGAGPAVPTSEVVRSGPGGNLSWHKGSLSKRFDGKEDSTPSTKTNTPSSTPTPAPIATHVAKGDEAAAMAAMFQAQSQNWEAAQEKMSHATYVNTASRGTGFRGGKPFTPQGGHAAMQQDRQLPPSYVCYRCGQKGHWIQQCPTNNDREFDNRPRIKRTTGIPRSMLKAVENPSGGEMTQGLMVTPEGGYVVAQPDLASWKKQVTRSKALTAAEVREKPPLDDTLACPIDNKLFRDAVKTPCCSKAYCEECIQTHLLERDFVCPNCEKKIPSLDKLIPDKSIRTKVSDYIEKKIEESRKEGWTQGGGEKGDEGGSGSGGQQIHNISDETNLGEQDIYSDQQPDLNMDMVAEQIPQLQAQINQLSQMLNNPNLPPQLRHQTEMQYQQRQMELQQAQTMQAALAIATFQQQQQAQSMGMAAMGGGFGMQNTFQGGGGGPGAGGASGWVNPGQQPSGDSAYQRLPVNNRRRNLKRDRPSDFVETVGPDGNKVARYWE